MSKLCPYCDRISDDEQFCDFCARPIHDVTGETKKEDKLFRDRLKAA